MWILCGWWPFLCPWHCCSCDCDVSPVGLPSLHVSSLRQKETGTDQVRLPWETRLFSGAWAMTAATSFTWRFRGSPFLAGKNLQRNRNLPHKTGVYVCLMVVGLFMLVALSLFFFFFFPSCNPVFLASTWRRGGHCKTNWFLSPVYLQHWVLLHCS